MAGDVDQPLVTQELHRRLHSGRGAVLGLWYGRPQLLLDDEDDAAVAIEAVRRQQHSVRQDDGSRRDRNHCRQSAIVPRIKNRTNGVGKC